MIRDALLTQKRELERRLSEKYVPKEAKIKDLENDLIKVIVGPRRAGKSFFAIRALSALGAFGYANFDDERLYGSKNYDEIIAALHTIYGNPKRLLLDEIQNLPKWELFVNRLARQGHSVTITGSNSNLLSRELSTHLTGRHVATHIFPFSFREFLGMDGTELTGAEARERLARYVELGGYPEPWVKKLDHKDYLATLFDSIVYKDIMRRFRIRSPQAIEALAVYLISNAAREFSYNSLARITGCKSAHTTEKYLAYLKEAFIFFTLSRFSYKVREQLSSNKKIYCTDNGFIHAKAEKSSPDLGRLYENAVAIELKRRELSGGPKVYYWKNQQQEEVDFVVRSGAKTLELIQVCYDMGSARARGREVRALLKASKSLSCNKLLVLTHDFESEEKIEWFGIKRGVRFLPLWKWLLRPNQK